MSKGSRVSSYLDNIESAFETITSRQSDLVCLASNKDKDILTLAVEAVEIEAATTSVIRAVEDLLVTTKSLREAWILGQTPQNDEEMGTERDLGALRELLHRIETAGTS